MKFLRFVFLPLIALSALLILLNQAPKEKPDAHPHAAAAARPVTTPPIPPSPAPASEAGNDTLIARTLSADPGASTATGAQQAAFAALQRKLSQSPEERMLEAASKDPKHYRVRVGDDGNATARNPSHAFAATFEPHGSVIVRPNRGADWNWQMKVIDLPAAGPVSADGPRIERSRGDAITEWYVNEERGLEQFFTLEKPIAGDGEESRIRIAMKTDLEPDMESDEHLVFRDTEGDEALHYHGLAVFDADETPLPARMELESAGPGETVVALVFDTTGAQFPVTVDPFVSTVLHRYEENNSSNPNEFAVIDGSTFVFAADDGMNGTELWKSDGTVAGTVMVKDIESGPGNSSPMHFTAAGPMVLFSADTSDTGRELWKTDLTEAGTELVFDTDPGSGNGISTAAGIFNIVGSRLVFPAENDTYGWELWASNGTAAGTGLLKDINGGDLNSYPSDFTLFNGELFFQADDDTHGNELWKTDGTPGGTVLVADINAVGSADSDPRHLTPFDGALYFQAVADGGKELWKSDGMVGGTTERVKDIRSGVSGSNPAEFNVFGGSLFFTADDGVNGNELWISDGTDAGTELLKDINPGSGSSSANRFKGTSGALFFRASDGTHGIELWKTDGTASGTALVRDIEPGSDGSHPGDLFADGSNLYFSADESGTGRELWMSDGTEAGTTLIKDIDDRIEEGENPESSSPGEFFVFGGTVFFQAFDEDGSELWTTDGTEGGTVKFKDINRTGTLESEPVKSGDRIFFAWDGDEVGIQLWASDGTPEGTGPIIPPGHVGDFDPEFLTDVDGTLFFTAQDEDHGDELWKSTGTNASTVLVKDIQPGDNGSDPEELAAVGGVLFFSARDDDHGRELWKSDGTAAGTVMVKDIYPGTSYSEPEEITDFDGIALFAADDGISGTELWKSDGTEAGTELVKNIAPDSDDSSNPENLVYVADLGLCFFVADDTENGKELWETNGTEIGTKMVKDIEPGPAGSDPDQLTDGGDKLYFVAFTTDEGRELWYSKGSEEGSEATQMVKDIAPGPADAQISQITTFIPNIENVGVPVPAEPTTAVVFLADDGTNGLEMWIVTVSGGGGMMGMGGGGEPAPSARLLLDLASGADSGFTSDAEIVYQERLYFPGNDGSGTVGTELYSPPVTDVPDVPVLHEDTTPGPEGSYPTGLVDLNGQLIWFASDDQGGYTLRSESGDVLPDLTVGKNLGVQKGDGIVNTSGAGQKQALVSKKFKKLKFHGWMHNDGDIAGRMSLSGNKSNKKFRVKYFGPTGNMTGQVVAGIYEVTIPPGEKKNYRVEIKPKRKLKNKKTGKIKRKNRTITLRMTSNLTSEIDGIKCKAKAR